MGELPTSANDLATASNFLPAGYRDLLLVLSVPGLYCLMVVLGRRLKRRHGVRLGYLYHLFALGLAICLPARLLEVTFPHFREVGSFTAILGAIFLIALVDRYIWELYFQQRHRVKVPKFLSEVARLAILIIALFLVLDLGYGQTIKGLLIAPGIAAVVIGLAMQDLMGNIIAGVALQVGKPFQHGDWLFVENRYAEVIEVNWRSTRLRTVDEISIEIPNRDLAKQTIVNLNLPSRLHAMRIPVSIDYAAPPTRVKGVLLHAMVNAKGVAPEPKPKVYLKNFADSAVEYEIKFWMSDHSQYPDICDAIRTNIWYGLQRHGIKIPYPVRTVQLERPARNKQQEVQSVARIMLRQQPLFKCLNDNQLDALLPRGRVVHFGTGETLIQQGDQGESMFILVNGEANVVVKRNDSPMHVASLSSGDCFGEMSLLTGERRNATIIAQIDCEVVEIGKPVIAQSLKENPDLLNKLSELLARRQLEIEGIVAANTQPSVVAAKQTQYEATFGDKLRAFFEL
ncbi:MAG: MscS Mechanosensitive ion channel [Pedosphaera sp.]|nr:MscS Mechanosensitive ion channel [Pedosphaera sp.]